MTCPWDDRLCNPKTCELGPDQMQKTFGKGEVFLVPCQLGSFYCEVEANDE